MPELTERLRAVDDRLHVAALECAHAERNYHAAEERAASAERRVLVADTALAMIHQVRDAETARAQETIANLCSEALRVVFEDPSLRIEARSVERRGVVETDLVLVRGGLETDPLQGNGGGLVAVAAAMLRLILVRLMVARGLAPLLVLDEPLAALSAGHRARMADTLRRVAADLGVQVLMVSHAQEDVMGTVYEVRWASRDDVLAEVVLAE